VVDLAAGDGGGSQQRLGRRRERFHAPEQGVPQGLRQGVGGGRGEQLLGKEGIAIGALVLLPIVAYFIFGVIFRERRALQRIQRYVAIGRYDRALPLLYLKLDRLRRKYGENHLDTAVAKFELGRIHYMHGRTAEGLRMVEEATAFFSTYSGPQDDVYWVHLLNLGVA